MASLSGLTESDLRGMVGIGFCAWRLRVSREMQASNFACGEMGEVAVRCGFLLLGCTVARQPGGDFNTSL
jgi:hypothetical protein